jgi:hypothetical protein
LFGMKGGMTGRFFVDVERVVWCTFEAAVDSMPKSEPVLTCKIASMIDDIAFHPTNGVAQTLWSYLATPLWVSNRCSDFRLTVPTFPTRRSALLWAANAGFGTPSAIEVPGPHGHPVSLDRTLRGEMAPVVAKSP